MTDGRDGPPPRGPGSPSPSLVVRFGGGEDVDPRELLEATRADLDRGQDRLAAADRLLAERPRLEKWLASDPDHPRLLLADPETALRQAVPGLEVPELSAAGREAVAQLARHHGAGDAGLLTYTPPETTALELLREVADDAGGRPDGYAALAADVEGTVARVAAGRYATDVVGRVVDGIDRGMGRSPSRRLELATLRPAPSQLATYLEQHPEARDHAVAPPAEGGTP